MNRALNDDEWNGTSGPHNSPSPLVLDDGNGKLGEEAPLDKAVPDMNLNGGCVLDLAIAPKNRGGLRFSQRLKPTMTAFSRALRRISLASAS
jgi:hypothetical protein